MLAVKVVSLLHSWQLVGKVSTKIQFSCHYILVFYTIGFWNHRYCASAKRLQIFLSLSRFLPPFKSHCSKCAVCSHTFDFHAQSILALRFCKQQQHTYRRSQVCALVGCQQAVQHCLSQRKHFFLCFRGSFIKGKANMSG